MQLTTTGNCAVSVVIPIFNEVESIPTLVASLRAVLDTLSRTYEIILVDDGSTDGSDGGACRNAAAAHREIKIIEFRRNAGQTAAMMAGIDSCLGRNHRHDRCRSAERSRRTSRCCSQSSTRAPTSSRAGARTGRMPPSGAILVSRIANRLISRVSGVQLHDYGCTLKAYRREVLQGMRLYGEMHRFVPIYASWMGAKVVEIPVRHHARRFGKSKYGLNRTFKVVLDLMVVKFFSRYLVKPIYVFGGFGIWSIFGGFVDYLLRTVPEVSSKELR